MRDEVTKALDDEHRELGKLPTRHATTLAKVPGECGWAAPEDTRLTTLSKVVLASKVANAGS